MVRYVADDNRNELNFAGLAERLVPLVAELLATLASQNPLRMHFAGIAEKTLYDIVEILRSDGLSQEAVAASLGMTISGYRAKMKKLRTLYAEAAPRTSAGSTTLLERVYDVVLASSASGGMRYEAIEERFQSIKTDSLKGVLHYLVQSGLLAVSGRGRRKRYLAVTRSTPAEANYHDVAVTLYRDGPLTAAELARRVGLEEDAVAEHIEGVRESGFLVEGSDKDGTPNYRSRDYHIPLDTAEGYEAAIWDHVATVLRAVAKKVRLGRHRATMNDETGGATFSFNVPEDAPEGREILSFLARSRTQLEEWLTWARSVADETRPGVRWRRVTVYLGQLTEDTTD